jgi:hypothetical protein
VERVVPNALFDSAIKKRLEDKSLHPRCRARKPAGMSLLAAQREISKIEINKNSRDSSHGSE